MHDVSQKYGRLPWRDLVEPAIELARGGFKISAAVAEALDNTKTKDFIKNDPGLRYRNMCYRNRK